MTKIVPDGYVIKMVITPFLLEGFSHVGIYPSRHNGGVDHPVSTFMSEVVTTLYVYYR